MCEHEKVYSPNVLASNPPQYPWVCRKCGERGTDRGEYHNAYEYDEVLKRFKMEG